MWDPNKTLAQWGRDDDLLSWRSLDTLWGMEMGFGGMGAPSEALHDSCSDTSDAEELAEVIDRRYVTKPAHSIPTGSVSLREDAPTQSRQSPSAMLEANRRRPTRVAEEKIWGTGVAEMYVDALVGELPSTSEMVTIQEPPGRSADRRPGRVGTGYVDDNQRQMEERNAMSQTAVEDKYSERDKVHVTHCVNEGKSSQISPLPVVESQRVSMTLGDLLARKKNAGPSSVIPPPTPPVVPIRSSAELSPAAVYPSQQIDSVGPAQELKAMEQQIEKLVNKEQLLQTALVKQLHQIESISEQLHQKDDQVQVQTLELSALKEKVAQLEKQNTNLQTSIREKEQALEQQIHVILQKTNELSTAEKKIQSLQLANDAHQEQARKAVEEKEKVHKDYLQVVYDLGKLQKQMNANAKEVVSVAEKDLLLREIDQLRHEKEQLVSKLKESDARRISLLQSSSVGDMQKMKELQGRVRELEDELLRVRNSTKATQAAPHSLGSSSPPLEAPFTRNPQLMRTNSSYDAGYLNPGQQYQYDINRSSLPDSGHLRSFHSNGTPTMPSLHDNLQPKRPERPMTLKDMIGQGAVSAASGVTSLASLGFSATNRQSSSSGGFDIDQFKADAYARRNTSIGDVLKHQSSFTTTAGDYGSPSSVEPALSAPFATEKQTLLQDSLQKRDLEQKLLKLHVEKEQTEAKLAKVEQGGLKTMSARTEKAWLESRARDLALEIGRLKLRLR